MESIMEHPVYQFCPYYTYINILSFPIVYNLRKQSYSAVVNFGKFFFNAAHKKG